MSFMGTDTYNVSGFASLAAPFDLVRKHVRNSRRKPRILNLCQLGD